jgi:hypothetical protein
MLGIVVLLSRVSMAGLRHQIESQGLGLLASWSDCALVILVPVMRCTAFPIRGVLLQPVRENFRQLVGRGRRRFRWPQCAAQAAIKCSERAGARAETWGHHAQGATGPIVATPTAGRQDVAAPHLVIGTASEPGGTRLVRRPCMPIAAPRGEEEVERWCLEPRPWREVDARAPGEMGAEINGGLVALGVPMGGRGWG